MLPILKGMMWQMIGSLLVTIMLLLSIAYLIKVMLLQKKVDKMRSDFVHTMIHELKRPVQTLKMCVSVFSSQKTDEKDENALIMETVREESDNLTAYLAKLREVIRAEEHIPLQITSFDIHAALQNLVAFYRKNRQKEVNVSLDYQRTSDLMMGDRDQLLNVVSNLMENSVKYSGDIVNIHVVCRDTGKEEVMISVSDNGIGISPDEQQRVWTKFYRSNAYPDMMQPGIGLGLSFVVDFVSNSENKFYLQIFGSLMLLVFGIYCFKSDPMKNMHKSSNKQGTLMHNGITAFLVTLSNPLIVFLFMATFAQFAFVVPDMPVEMGVGYLSIVFGALLWWFGLTWLIDTIRNKFDTNGIVIINKVIGSVVIIFSIIALFGTIFNLYHLPEF